MAAYTRESSPTLSMREKTLLKRRINREHNSNFRAGYVQINEEHLHKTGIRGRKQYVIFAFMIIVFVLAILNLLITITIIGVLRINMEGMESLEFIPYGKLFRFIGDSDMNDVLLHDNKIHSLPYEDLEISGSNSKTVDIRTVDQQNNASLSVNSNRIRFTTNDGFEITDPETGDNVFTTEFSKMKFPDKTNSIKAEEVNTHRVTSRINENLSLESLKESVTMKGNEGLEMDGMEIVLTAKNDLEIKTAEELVIDGGGEGIYLTQSRLLPVTSPGGSRAETSFKICVCVNSGRLFGVPAPLRCDQANEDENPCEEKE